jgi:hypothetical protein
MVIEGKKIKGKPKKKRIVVQVHDIWDHWDKYDDDKSAIEDFASNFNLDHDTVKQVVSLSIKLVVASPSVQFSAGVCPRRGSLREIVKCAAAARSMILEK